MKGLLQHSLWVGVMVSGIADPPAFAEGPLPCNDFCQYWLKMTPQTATAEPARIVGQPDQTPANSRGVVPSASAFPEQDEAPDPNVAARDPDAGPRLSKDRALAWTKRMRRAQRPLSADHPDPDRPVVSALRIVEKTRRRTAAHVPVERAAEHPKQVADFKRSIHKSLSPAVAPAHTSADQAMAVRPDSAANSDVTHRSSQASTTAPPAAHPRQPAGNAVTSAAGDLTGGSASQPKIVDNGSTYRQVAGLSGEAFARVPITQPYPCSIQASGDPGECRDFGLHGSTEGCIKVDGVIDSLSDPIQNLVVTVMVHDRVVTSLHAANLVRAPQPGTRLPFSGVAALTRSEALQLNAKLLADRFSQECLVDPLR